MERDTCSAKFPISSALPEFELLNVDGRKLGSTYLRGGKAALIVFSCNHCPYVKGTDKLLIEIAKRFEKDGLRTVAINSNDAEQYPEDGYDKMKEKAAALLLPFPYLHDDTQNIARLFDAACTPESFLFDASFKLVYQGAITDRPQSSDGERKDLLSPAILQLIKGEKVSPDFNHPIGCSIKWRR